MRKPRLIEDLLLKVRHRLPAKKINLKMLGHVAQHFCFVVNQLRKGYDIK